MPESRDQAEVLKGLDQIDEPEQDEPEQEARSSAELWSEINGPGFKLDSRRLWLVSMALYKSGHPSLAHLLKNINSMIYSNSLPEKASVGAGIILGHQATGTVLHPNVVIGRRVTIFQNVTMAVRPPLSPAQIVIEDDVVIGANAVIMPPRNKGIRIGKGAGVGAGAVVTHDVPPHTIAISQPVELRPRARPWRKASDTEPADAGDSEPANAEQR